MRSDYPGGLRRAAAHAVQLARTTSDQNLRAALLELALKWVSQEPTGIEAQRRLDGALQEFNQRQLFDIRDRRPGTMPARGAASSGIEGQGSPDATAHGPQTASGLPRDGAGPPARSRITRTGATVHADAQGRQR